VKCTRNIHCYFAERLYRALKVRLFIVNILVFILDLTTNLASTNSN